jgi:hypothetical protein
VKFHYTYIYLFLISFSFSCNIESAEDDTLFQKIDVKKAGVDFINQLDQTEELNTYTFRNFYNGAGVAVGDINNDGLLDIYFCGNTRGNRLYLNKGDFRFEDVTANAGVACEDVWSTGASMIDINGDSYLDIYVCKSGQRTEGNRHNELFINNGNLTFTEKSESYGLNITGLSIQATFLDFDRDGDLDCYLLNNSFTSVESFDPEKNMRDQYDPDGANMLLRNDEMYFTNITREAGMYSSKIGFGLGATVTDINKDNWPDLYISNDFFEKDYLYINNQDGTFHEELEEQITETSMGAMGADIADINNDGFSEIYVTEMTAENNARLKTKTVFQSWESYQKNLSNGYYHQFARNTLQLNNQNNTFSEIGRYAGVDNTDWSWGALIFDIDNDGFKDIFVANGIYKDLLDRDYLEFYANPRNVRNVFQGSDQGILSLIDKMPSVKVPNYAFINNKDLSFKNASEKLGLSEPGFSNGTAYGDLDNDGDLDLVINNINMEPFIYRNELEKHLQNNFLTITLRGDHKNTQAIGSKVTIYSNLGILYQELVPVRGFMSSVDPRLNFGLGQTKIIDSLVVSWTDGSTSVLRSIPVNQFMTIDKSESEVPKNHECIMSPRSLFSEEKEITMPVHSHLENDFVDFERYKMLFHMRSNEGPKICVGDIDSNGMEDFYICGAKDSPGTLFMQTSEGFAKSNIKLLEQERISEETDCIFFDADNDGDLDLYVTCGSLEYPSSSTALVDKLYFNDGKGLLTKSNQILPSFTFESTSCVRPYDVDRDGDLDLFIGVRLKPFMYGIPPSSYILGNDGNGNFQDITDSRAPGLKNIGHVTDASWNDIDQDGDDDLVIVGEWMPITIFYNEDGILQHQANSTGLEYSNGWWHVVSPSDVDNDGDVDFIVGNQGKNVRFEPTSDHPVSMYVNDFDLNGSIEQIITAYNDGVSYPVVMKSDIVEQMPSLASRITRFEDYRDLTLDSIFDENTISKSVIYHAYNFETSVILNLGDGKFSMLPLPKEAQFSPTYGLLVHDWNNDGNPDILLGGNQSRSKPEIGIYKASYGLFLEGIGNGEFKFISPNLSGICLEGEIRDFDFLRVADEEIIIVARNNDVLKYLKLSDQ